MADSLVILDPTDETRPMMSTLAQRPSKLGGTLGIIDISKARGDVFCDELELLLAKYSASVKIERFRKPTFTKPATDDFREEVGKRCDAIIQALAD
tara:strand:+ start:18604 stop:18891 length:288 start_codon:yes stop_codon:yes gene_type:complete